MHAAPLEQVAAAVSAAYAWLTAASAKLRAELGDVAAGVLVVRVHLPEGEGERMLYVDLVDNVRLDIKLDTRTESVHSLLLLPVPLPVPVSVLGSRLFVRPVDGGAVDIMLSVLDDKWNGSHSHKLFVERVPSQKQMEACGEQFEFDKLQQGKCYCDIVLAYSNRAACYQAFVTQTVDIARAIGLDNIATASKHEAIECDDEPNVIDCLNTVSNTLVQALLSENVTHTFVERQHQQLSPQFHPVSVHSSLHSITKLVLFTLVVAGTIVVVMLLLRRRFRRITVPAFISQLSRMLTQSTHPNNIDTKGCYPASRTESTGAIANDKIA